MKQGQRRALRDTAAGRLRDRIEHLKAHVRARGEHAFRVIKRQFGYVKVRYRGLTKNTAQLHTLFALANIWMVHRQPPRYRIAAPEEQRGTGNPVASPQLRAFCAHS